jgi:osmotically-inducible protein OsmY
MESFGSSDIVPVPQQFAEGNTGEGRDLQRRIMACLKDRFPALRGVHVTVIGGTADLRGEVSSKTDKRLCVEYCRHVPGVLKIVDELIVAEKA